jgi:acetyl-CoA C-acetyltransferase
MTINKVCASGMKSIIFGAMGIQLGNSNVAVVGGFENMSRIPYYLTREKLKQPDARPANGLFYDGLTDAFGAGLMGICAEKTASDFSITKQD